MYTVAKMCIESVHVIYRCAIFKLQELYTPPPPFLLTIKISRKVSENGVKNEFPKIESFHDLFDVQHQYVDVQHQYAIKYKILGKYLQSFNRRYSTK